MGRLGLAFKILFSGSTAKQVSELLSQEPAGLPEPKPEPRPATPPPPPKPRRSEAITLLSALQREARFVDFIQEPIDVYNDAQVGAAVREVHRGCHEVLSRMFDPAPVVDQEEGSAVSVKEPASGRYRLTGNVAQVSDSVSGELVHHGWVAQRCEVPQWSGDDKSTDVIAAAEVQVS
ncbi:MAG: DUF2760 domain-containing protein [Fuerstiella sp.]